MSCEEVIELIQRNLDHDLSASESIIMHEHLRTCSECQSLNESLSQLSLELENLPDVEPPVSIVDRIIPQLEAMNQESSVPILNRQRSKFQQQGPLFWRKWALAAGGAAAVLLIWLSTEHLWTSEMENPKVQMQSASDQSRKETASPSDSPEVALHSTERVLPEQPTEKQAIVSSDPIKEAAPKEKPAIQKDQTLAFIPADPSSKKQETLQEGSKKQAKEQKVPDQKISESKVSESPVEEAPQEKVPMEQMPSIAAVLPPTWEESIEQPMVSTFMAPESNDTQDTSTRKVMVYPSPNGEWSAQLDAQTIMIQDNHGIEVFRSHSWTTEMEASEVDWLDEHHLQYTLVPVIAQELSPESPAAEKWIINILDKEEQKQ